MSSGVKGLTKIFIWYVNWLGGLFDIWDFTHYQKLSFSEEISNKIQAMPKCWTCNYGNKQVPGCKYWESWYDVKSVRYKASMIFNTSRYPSKIEIELTDSQITSNKKAFYSWEVGISCNPAYGGLALRWNHSWMLWLRHEVEATLRPHTCLLPCEIKIHDFPLTALPGDVVINFIAFY